MARIISYYEQKISKHRALDGNAPWLHPLFCTEGGEEKPERISERTNKRF